MSAEGGPDCTQDLCAFEFFLDVSGRKPHGVRNRMIERVGWKRLGANRMFKFSDVGKKDFNAMLRRSFACCNNHLVHPLLSRLSASALRM